MLSDLLTSFIELDETNNSSQGNEAVIYKILRSLHIPPGYVSPTE